ncbi:MAG: TolC family protein, partial [bacterium]
QDGVVRHRQAQIDELKATESVKSQIEVMLKKLEAIQHQILVAQQNASWATETLNFEEERYRLGAATIIEVTTAQSSFVQTQMELAALYSDYHILLAQLEKLVGTKLKSRSPSM